MKSASAFGLLLLALCCLPCLAQNRHILPPEANTDLVGSNSSAYISRKETLIDVAVRYQLGYNMIRSANPDVDAWLPDDGSKVLLPFSVILPNAPRKGIVINTAEMRLFFYRKDEQNNNTVTVYPISVGRRDWATPLTETRVTLRVEHPPWYPPESIRAEHAARGDVLPKVVPAGPDNPLGDYLLALAIPSYFIHGTNKRFGIGMQVTHGCIRMYPEHIEELYNLVPINTPVTIVNQPHKVGWKDEKLYLEVHHPLELDGVVQAENRTGIVDKLTPILEEQPEVLIDWNRVDRAIKNATGMPVLVGIEPHSLSDFEYYRNHIRSDRSN
ncbi:L,D-transpeptidase family protein [Porticoccus sp.]